MLTWNINLLTWGGQWLVCGPHSGRTFAEALAKAQALHPNVALWAGVSSRLTSAGA